MPPDSASAIRQSAQKSGPVPQYGAGPLRSQFVPKRFGYREHILVATSRQTNDNHFVAGHGWGDLGHLRDRMGGLESWNDALQFAGELKRIQRFAIGDRDIIHPAGFFQP